MRKSRDQNLTILLEAGARKLVDWKILDSSWQVNCDLKRKLAGHLCLVISRKTYTAINSQDALALPGRPLPVGLHTRQLLEAQR